MSYAETDIAELTKQVEWLIEERHRLMRVNAQQAATINRVAVNTQCEIVRIDPTASSKTHYTFEELAEIAKQKLGIDRVWQTHFETQAGFSHSIVEGWKSENTVPASAMMACKLLIPAVPLKRIIWTKKLKDRLAELSENGNLSYQQRAKAMAKDFPEYDWNHNKISGQVSRMGLKKA